MLIQVPFVGPDYGARSSAVQSQRTVNLYPQFEKPGAKNVIALYPAPGLSLHAQVGPGPCRSNGVEFQDALYFVNESKLVKLDGSTSFTNVGTLNSSGGRCSLVAGRDYLLVVDGTDGYTYDGTTFAEIADADFPAGPTHCAYLDGYFIVNKGDSDEFYISALEDPTGWNALDFATAEASPDDILALEANFKDLYLLGRSTTELYYNSGDPDFPFTPYPGGTLEVGIKAPYSLAKSPYGLFFLGTTKVGGVAVVQVQGQQINEVSSDQSWEISQFESVEDATGFVYRHGGKTIYQITFPTELRTFEYLIEDGVWVERQSYQIGRYRASGYGYLGNKHILGDYNNGNFYELDYDTYTENGALIERIRRCQHFHNLNKRYIWHKLTIDFEGGVGLVTGQGSDPQAMLRWSDDGGYTWSSERWVTLGALGNYGVRAVWRNLGQSRNRIYEVKVTDPVKTVIVNAYADVTECLA